MWKENDITPNKRIIEVLRGGSSNRIPFTAYDCFLSGGFYKGDLQARGLLVVKPTTSYRTVFKNVDIKTMRYADDRGRIFVRTSYVTPIGELSTLVEVGKNTTWMHEHLFRSPEDFRALRYLVKSMEAVADYSTASKLVEKFGRGCIIRDNLPLEPMQSLISSIYMSAEDFSYQWHDNRDEIMELYEAFVDFNQKVYPIVTEGPLEIVNYGGNVIPQIIGREIFEDYYLPHYSEAAEMLHRKNKLLGCHLDGDNTPIMDLIARSDLDYIEAYDPGMGPGLREARRIFAKKAIWINWPSGWHLCPQEEIRKRTNSLIEDAGSPNGFIIGITEDMPLERRKVILKGILDGIDDSDVQSP